MGISEFIAKKKALKPIRRRENIELQKPIINLFVGEFSEEDKNVLKEVLNSRIGENNKVNYLNIVYGTCSKVPERLHECTLILSNMEKPPEHGTLEDWEKLKDAAQSSTILEQIVRDYANNIFNEVSTVPYIQKASIRLNLLIQMDSVEVAALESFVVTLKQELTVFFNNGVFVDAYCFLDQRGFRLDEGGENRKAYNYLALQTVDHMAEQQIIKMAFCLSNFTSLECLWPDSVQERIKTAALMMLLKDGRSASSQMPVDTYEDAGFTVDCLGSEGRFYSLGHFKLEVAENLIDYIVYHTVFDAMCVDRETRPETRLERLELSEEQVDLLCQELLPVTSFPQQIFYSMVKNSEKKASIIVHSSREEVIDSIYGQNLDLFFLFNCERNYIELIKEVMVKKEERIDKILRTMYSEENHSLSDMNIVLKDVLHHLNCMRADCMQLIEAEQREMQSWLGERNTVGDLRSVVKETKEPVAFYQIASEYLEKRVWSLHLKVKLQVIDAYIKMVQKTARQYHALSDKMAEAVRELECDIEAMMQTGVPISSMHAPEYYGKLAKNIISSDNQFELFEKMINSKIFSEGLSEESLFERIIHYCDEKILTNPEFQKDFSVEMLKRLKDYKHYHTDESIYEFAFETIMENQVFYTNVVTYNTLHQSICFMVNPYNRFVASTNERMQQLKDNRQLKVFFEEHYDDMDVLYMEGRFGLENLYNYQTYKGVYQHLKKD